MSSSNSFSEACLVIPGGVNSPVRAWKSVGGDPVFVAKAKGSKIFDVDDRSYVDYVLSWGPMILGHAHPEVVAAICQAAQNGTSFGAPTEAETKMAQLIHEAFPSMEHIRMTSSGTEATMTAVRLARGYTGRNMVIKFDGCYHGHADALLVKAGSGVATLGIPGSPGIPSESAKLTLSLPYNDIEAFEDAVNRYASDLAAVIVEPVAGNMGVVLPRTAFLKTLRNVTQKNGIVLIFDEVITGFRFGFGGYQNQIGISPDLTCLGKIIGGGLPVGAVGGKKEIMTKLAPSGDVYQAGTLSGNPLAMKAGIATLELLKSGQNDYATLGALAASLCEGLSDLFSRQGIPVCINKIGSMFTVFFQEGPVENFQSALCSDTQRFGRFFHGMLENGVWLAPSQFEAGFVSFAHTDADLENTLRAAAKALKKI